MVPDLRTLFLIISILCVLQALGMVVLWTLNRRIPGISCWAASNVLNAFAMGLMPLQGVIDNQVIHTLVPNLCAVAAAVCHLAGTCQFLGGKPWKRSSAIAVGLWLPPYLYFLFGDENLQPRIVLCSLVLAFLYGKVGMTLMREQRGGMRFSLRFTAVMFHFFTAVLIFRTIKVASGPPPVTLFDGSTLQWFTFLSVATFAYLRSFGVILMINQRQTLELNEQHAAQRRVEEALEIARREAEEQRSLRQRQALVRDLHDGIGGITANLAMLAALGREEETAAVREEMLKHIQTIALEGNREVRSLMNSLEHGKFHWSDWLAELREYSHKTTAPLGIHLRWQSKGEATQAVITEPTAALSLARAVKEAIHNLTRHSQSTEARIEIEFQNEELGILIADTGRGLPPEPTTGRGLRNMRRRLQELGGSLAISVGGGTQLRFTVPLPLKNPDPDLATP